MKKKQQMNQLVDIIKKAMVNVKPIKGPESIIPAIPSGPLPKSVPVGAMGGKKNTKRRKDKRKQGKKTKRNKRR